MAENPQEDFSQSIELIKLGFKYFAKQQEQLIAQQKREYRKQMATAIVRAILNLDELGLHSSDIFQALADWAYSEKDKFPEETQTWEIAVLLLSVLASEAEEEGRELP